MCKKEKGSIAVLYICTGKYVTFWRQFFRTFQKRFITDYRKEYFVFTDAERIFAEETENVHRIYQKLLGWPGDTLMRFHMFLSIESLLRNYDYIFFFNANCQCKSRITAEEFLPVEENLLFVQHPGMYNKTPQQYTYERNEKSQAYIPVGEGAVYVCGGVNGGKAPAFLDVMKELRDRIDLDLKNGIIAIYHDESHINRYVYEHPSYKLLSPAYCNPQEWRIPYKKKIVILDKKRYFDVEKVKNGNE